MRNGGYSHAADQLGDAKEFAITPDFDGDLGRITDDKTVLGQGYAIVPSKALEAQRLRPFQRLPAHTEPRAGPPPCGALQDDRVALG